MLFTAHRSWRGNLGSESPDGIKGSSEVTEEWNVSSSFPTSSPVVKALAPIPRMGYGHPDNPFLQVRRVSIDVRSPIYFICRITYRAESIDGENPLDEPPDISISSISSTEEIDSDIDGKPILTPNGEPITGLTEVIPDMQVTVSRNLATFNPWSIFVYMNKVSSDTFLNFPAGVIKVMDVRARNIFTEDFEYWNASVTVQSRQPLRASSPEKAWFKRVMLKGFLVKDGNGDVRPARNPVTNELETSQVRLKPDGTRETDPTKAHFIEVKTVEKIALNSLNLLS